MTRIRSRGNQSTELALGRLSPQLGAHRAPLHQPRVQGLKSRRFEGHGFSPQSGEGGILRVRPDFVFPKLRLAVFVDDCFWHACPRHGTKPKGNGAFWRKKFAANQARDQLVTRTLRKVGWRPLRIWEHDLHRDPKRTQQRRPPPSPEPAPRSRRGGCGSEAGGAAAAGVGTVGQRIRPDARCAAFPRGRIEPCFSR